MIDRRSILRGALAAASVVAPQFARGEDASRVTAYAFTFKGLDGHDILLSAYSGRPLLIVNTASLCGYTPQYAGLESLWTRFRDRGLMLIGVPCNDFGGQEPGGATDILHTAVEEYHVTFPLTAKVSVRGPDAHPFYRWAARERPLETPRWNFHKYLVDRGGHLRAGFASAVAPLDPKLVIAVEQELAAA